MDHKRYMFLLIFFKESNVTGGEEEIGKGKKNNVSFHVSFNLLRRVFTQQIQSVNSSPQGSGHVQFLACFKEKASTANAQIFHGLNSHIEFVEWKPYCR